VSVREDDELRALVDQAWELKVNSSPYFHDAIQAICDWHDRRHLRRFERRQMSVAALNRLFGPDCGVSVDIQLGDDGEVLEYRSPLSPVDTQSSVTSTRAEGSTGVERTTGDRGTTADTGTTGVRLSSYEVRAFAEAHGWPQGHKLSKSEFVTWKLRLDVESGHRTGATPSPTWLSS
jgi:hypothetical protein